MCCWQPLRAAAQQPLLLLLLQDAIYLLQQLLLRLQQLIKMLLCIRRCLSSSRLRRRRLACRQLLWHSCLGRRVHMCCPKLAVPGCTERQQVPTTFASHWGPGSLLGSGLVAASLPGWHQWPAGKEECEHNSNGQYNPEARDLHGPRVRAHAQAH